MTTRYSWAVRAVLFCIPVICIVVAGHSAEQNVLALRNVPGGVLKMRVPAGYCEVNPAGTEAERAQYELVEKSLTDGVALAYFADCASYAKLGSIAALESWILVAGKLTNGIMQPIPGYTRAEILDAVAASAAGPQGFAKGLEQGEAKMEQAFKDFGIDVQMQSKMVGVLGRDINGVYQGIAVRQVVNGQILNVVGIGGGTFVKNYLISLNIYRQYQSPQTINELLAVSKELHRDFVALNEPAR